MQPFTVSCTACGKSLKVTKPEYIGRTVNCPGCKAKFKIEQPAEEEEADSAESIAPGSFDLNAASASAASASAASSGAPAFNPEASSGTSSYARKKQSQPAWVKWAPLGAFVALVVGFVAWRSFDTADQDRIYNKLSGSQKASVDAAKAKGENVRLEEIEPRRTAEKPKERPKPKADRPRSPLHDELIGRLLAMKRAHKQSLDVAALQQKVDNANYRYRQEEIELEAFDALLGELAQEIETKDKALVSVALQNTLQLFQVDAAVIGKFAPAFDAAVRAARVPMWKLDDATKKQVDDAVQRTLTEHELDKQQDLVAKMLEFAVEYY